MSEKQIDLKELAELSNKVQLETILLQRISAVRHAFFSEGTSLLLSFEILTPWARNEHRPGFNVFVAFRASLQAVMPSTKDQTPTQQALADLEQHYELEYRLPEAAPSDWDERLDAFAKLNAVVNAWPYVRQDVQMQMLRLGLPPIVLPVYRPGRPTRGTLTFNLA